MPVLNAIQLFYSEVAMNALFASLAWCLAKPNRASILSTVLCAAIWPFVNKPLEGHILMVLRPGDGITTSDMLSAIAVIVVAAQAIRMQSRARTRGNSQTPEPHQGPLPAQNPGTHIDLDQSPTHPTVPLRYAAGPATYRRLRPASAPAPYDTRTRPPRHSPRRVVHQRSTVLDRHDS